MGNYLQALDLNLSKQSVAGKTRHKVLSETPWAPTPTTHVSYVAANRLLIIANLDTAKDIESRLPEKIICYIAEPSEKSTAAGPLNAYRCAGLGVSGYLGRFEVVIDNHLKGDGEHKNLAKLFNVESGLFDQVLDGSEQPLISAAIKPPGYHYIGDDQNVLVEFLENIPELIGEFEKPRYFEYNASICAHGRSGIPGCTKCLDACPTDAIFSIGESIEVNPHLCQGGGTCASSCPTGAINYVYPRADEQVEFLRSMLKSLRDNTENRGVTLLLFDNEHGRDDVQVIAEQFNDHVIPYVVEEIGSVGLDMLVAALSYGANQIYVYVPDEITEQVHSMLTKNLRIVDTVLEQTDCSTHRVSMINNLNVLCNGAHSETIEHAATFAAAGDKRSIIRAGLSFFNEISEKKIEAAQLPSGSLFGQTQLTEEKCTLCMGCVSVCPAGALQAGGESPALKFIEANCVQCGICTRACPETAMQLESRLHFDFNITNAVRTLKEEAPFLCIDCGKPFATKSMIAKITEKLQGHWMFDKPDGLDRLRMCEDCRVKDMFDKNDLIS